MAAAIRSPARSVAMAVVVAITGGCSSPAPVPAGSTGPTSEANTAGRHPDPSAAIASCHSALRAALEAPVDNRAVIVAEGCSDLFVEAACRDAMRRTGDVPHERRTSELALACSAAYCPLLPEPRAELCGMDAADIAPAELPEHWSSFVEQVYVFDLGEVGRPLAGLHSRAFSPLERPPPQEQESAPSPRITIAITEAGVEITITRPEGQSESRRVAIADLRPDLAAALDGTSTEATVAVSAEADVPYDQVVAVFDALRSAGFERVSLQSR